MQVVETADRAAVGELLTMNEYVDIIVPRGGKELIERLMRESRIPMIKHLDGVCHVYIDDRADPAMAVRIADNAKTQRYGTCNTMETLLVAEGIAREGAAASSAKIYRDKGVEMRGDEARAQARARDAKPATEEDWYTEYLAPILAIRVVKGLDEAIEHIAKYGSQHTDAIVTEDEARAQRFLREVDSSSVMVNASTRFADGFEYGLGAEIGISTDKLHARGPVGPGRPHLAEVRGARPRRDPRLTGQPPGSVRGASCRSSSPRSSPAPRCGSPATRCSRTCSGSGACPPRRSATRPRRCSSASSPGTLAFAFFAVADRLSPRLVFFVCSLAGAAANARRILARGRGLVARSRSRFATGFFLAGIYPVGHEDRLGLVPARSRQRARLPRRRAGRRAPPSRTC